ncbi:glycosyltransferase [bacterium]|nr:glycosyltransferase [candidate division CSSED10-310 bacterium]
MKSVAIIVPAFNESQTISNTIRALADWTPPSGVKLTEIIVVDDGSSDNTNELIQTAIIHHPQVICLKNSRNLGKGYSVTRGILHATADIVGFTDADLSYPPSLYDEFILPFLNGNIDVVVGSRRHPKHYGYRQYPFKRRAATHFFQLFIRMLGLTTVSDSQCGLKFFTRDAANRVFSRTMCSGFSFDVELLFLCRRYGFNVREIPVEMEEQRPSTIRLTSQVPRMLMDLLKIRFRHLKRKF